MNVELLKLRAYVENSMYRIRIINHLSIDDVKIPSKLAKECDIGGNHISIYLSQLKKKNLIECINEEMSKGRMYKLTKQGYEVKNMMNR